MKNEHKLLPMIMFTSCPLPLCWKERHECLYFGMFWSVKTSKPFQSSVAFYIETNHLICATSQVTAFYMKCSSSRLKRLLKLVHWVIPFDLCFPCCRCYWMVIVFELIKINIAPFDNYAIIDDKVKDLLSLERSKVRLIKHPVTGGNP